MTQDQGQSGAYPILRNEEAVQNVLARAKRESWTAIALLPTSTSPADLQRLAARGFPRSVTFLTRAPVSGPALEELCSIRQLTHLDLTGNQIGEPGARNIATSLPGLISLDLAGNRIGEAGARAIAASLGNLTSLGLAGNQIGAGGAQAIANSLAGLTSLDLGGNPIGNSGAHAVAALKEVISLVLWQCEIGEKGARVIAASLEALASLDLGFNQIGELGAKAIAASLKGLTSLKLAANRVGEAGAKAIAASLKDLTSLDLAQNRIADAGARNIAASLQGLTSLVLWSNQIGDTGAQVIAASLKNLTSLDLGLNEIGDAGAQAIAISLKDLTSLDLAANQVGETGARNIAASLKGLTSLRLAANRVGNAGAQAIAASLKSLTSLDLGANQLGNAGAQAIAASLKALSSLDLAANQVGEAGAQAIAASLKNLTSLNLAGNTVGEAGAQAIAASLTRLASLDLSANQIGNAGARSISVSLVDLSSLKLAGNQISDAGAQAIAASLKDLTSLDLAHNQIGDATLTWLARLSNLEQLNLSENRAITSKGVLSLFEAIIREPSRVVRLERLDLTDCQDFSEFFPKELLDGKDAQALLAAYRRRGDRRPLNELKLLVVGNEAVGKTSLIRYLREDQPRDPGEQKTPGVVLNEKIEVSNWSVAKSQVGINIWDFGGQEIMHGTHRYFLTQRSLYLLVLEARREDSQEEALEHWLRVIESRGGGSPVLVVVNKAEKDHVYHPDEQRYRRKYPSIAGFVRTTCNDDQTSRASIQELREAIVQIVENDARLSHIRDRIPVAWLEIKSELEQLAKQRKTVDYAEYVALCADPDKAVERRVTEGAEQKGLLRLLHDLGVVIAHGLEADASAARRELTLLDPNWLTRAIYTVLNSGRLRAEHGVFQASRLHDFLDPAEYPRARFEFIVDMMQHPDIGLCFALPDQRGSFLVPEALPTTEPDCSWAPDALRFCYSYELLPPGLVPRLIVEAHGLLSHERPTLWKAGAVFDAGHCKVLVRADCSKNRVDLSIFGPKRRRREALGIMRDYLRRVHALYLALGERARVPLPDQTDVAVSYEHLLELELDEGPAYSWRPEGANRKYTVSELLDGVRSASDAPGSSRNPDETSGAAREKPARKSWKTEVVVAAVGGVVAIAVAAINLVPTLVAKPCEEGKSVACEKQCTRGLEAKKLCSNERWGTCECLVPSISAASTPPNNPAQPLPSAPQSATSLATAQSPPPAAGHPSAAVPVRH